ncbi:aminotransferase class III-fold pyridoxal phosphate-dependent enzyme [Candidatus Woesearchaeota archaeon]|nr:aminotransferase class III-fold pyridoxal phosphate-dependent enzyme [Candidatus Woesearchaeota archaeon]
MKTAAIIQARMGSTRLPGKMIKLLGDKPLFWHVIDRVKKAKEVDEVVLATGDKKNNDILVEEMRKHGGIAFRGDEDDVLDRFYHCAKKFGIDVIVRITGDCPLIDSRIIDEVVILFKNNDADYASNVHPPTYPDGFDVEVFSFKALEKAWKEAKLKSEREHVTPYIWKNKEMFKCINLKNNEDLSDLRLTVDDDEDFILLDGILKKITAENYNLKEIVNTIRENPELLKINKNISRNEGYKKSLKGDKTNMNFDKSLEWLEKAKKIIPTASQTYSKSYKYFCEGAAPVFLDSGEGGRVWDIDGNEFIDFVCGLGAITLGYNNGYVNKAISEQLKKGISFSQANILEFKLAKKLIEIIPCAEMVKFIKNGSDATTAAVRLARAYTGKEVVACCGYHGYHDWYIGTTTNDLGVPKAVKELTKTFEYNNIDSLKKIFEENKGKVAAVILEPCQMQGPENGFLKKVKEITHENNAVLIFDEVVSGFRMGLGGAQEYYDVIPDLSAFGKGMGNGLAISAVVGKKDIMRLIDEGVFISSTFGGETLSLAGALATIHVLGNPESFKHIFKLGNYWLKEVKKLINGKKLEGIVKIYGVSPHCGVVFNDKEGISKEEFMTIYQSKLIEKGILSVGVNNFCLSHTIEDVNKFIEAVAVAFDEVKKAVKLGSVDGLLNCGKFRPVFNRNN